MGVHEEYDVVLCDFGLCARVSEGKLLDDFCGSPGFFAPEMFVHGSYDGKQADVWSIGCILLELLVGHDTFGECWMTAYSKEYMRTKKGFRDEIEAAVAELKVRARKFCRDGSYFDCCCCCCCCCCCFC